MIREKFLCAAIVGLMGIAVAQTTAPATASYKAEMEQSMQKMHHVMSPNMLTGNPDKDFLIMMIPHHQGAVDMAKVELRYGENPALKEMAQTIISTQEKEIQFMQSHLAKLDAMSSTSAAGRNSRYVPTRMPVSEQHQHTMRKSEPKQ